MDLVAGEVVPETTVTVHNGNGQRMSKVTLQEVRHSLCVRQELWRLTVHSGFDDVEQPAPKVRLAQGPLLLVRGFLASSSLRLLCCCSWAHCPYQCMSNTHHSMYDAGC